MSIKDSDGCLFGWDITNRVKANKPYYYYQKTSLIEFLKVITSTIADITWLTIIRLLQNSHSNAKNRAMNAIVIWEVRTVCHLDDFKISEEWKTSA